MKSKLLILSLFLVVFAMSNISCTAKKEETSKDNNISSQTNEDKDKDKNENITQKSEDDKNEEILVNVASAIDLLPNSNYEDVEEFYFEYDPDYIMDFVFYSENDVKDFKLLQITDNHYDDKSSETLYETSILYTIETLTPQRPFLASIPTGPYDFAISYTDNNKKTRAFALHTLSDGYKLSEIKLYTPPVSVGYADDVLSNFSKYDTFVAEESEYNVDIVFYANETVKDFKLLSLDDMNIDFDEEKSIPVFDAIQIYSLDKLSPKRPLLVSLTFYGSIPHYAISYTTAKGDTKTFSIDQSGFDDSVYLGSVIINRVLK